MGAILSEIEAGNEVLAPWCELISSEQWVKDNSKAYFVAKAEAAAKAKETPG